jgi:hypothetical protein
MLKANTILKVQNVFLNCFRPLSKFSGRQLFLNFLIFLSLATNLTVVARGEVGRSKQGGSYDGPAELPRATVASAMSDTPAPGSIISVSAGGDLQGALNSAQCGDQVELQAGAAFTGLFTLPAKNCNSKSWIIVRSSASSSALPAEGQRATPCYAGIATLEGRPQYPCNNPQNVMAKVQMAVPGDGPFRFANGANYYRFLGLEVTRPEGVNYAARLITADGTADHLVFDRMWLHGALQDETYVGVGLSGITNAAIVDSYFSDFHCISVTGRCTDAHDIGGGIGNTQDGPFKIDDNFLEASGESVMFGGGGGTTTPTDITITNNHFWKPWQWMPGNPKFIGGKNGKPFIVKNHLELKNAVRVLVEANLLENNWSGFSQAGFSILLTPKNQHSGNTNICPMCQVTDITVRYAHISHVGSGIQLATSISGNGKGGGEALAGTRWSIHDVVLDDLSVKYAGGGAVFEIANGWTKNPLNTVTINHVTGFPDVSTHMMTVGNAQKNAQMYGFVFTNNLLITADYPVWNSVGGSASCATKDVPITSIQNCLASSTFANNGLIAPPPQYPPATWPAKNMFPTTVDAVGFTDFNNGSGGNYQLLSSSPYKNKGLDGKDLGADIAGLNAALANVE